MRGRSPAAGLAPWTEDLAGRHGRAWSPAAATRYCRALLRERDPNLATWSRLLGRPQAEALSAVYAFVRIADDLADEDEFADRREELLAAWAGQLRREGPRHPALIALARTVERYRLPAEELDDLAAAWSAERRSLEPATWDELVAHGRRAGAPIGRLVLRVLGSDAAARPGWSDRLSAALYLTVRWRNLARDLGRGQVFFPRDDLERFAVSRGALLARHPSPAFLALMRATTRRTRGLYREAGPLAPGAGPRAWLPLAALWLSGRAVLHMVDRAGAGILRRAPRLDPLALAGTALAAGLARAVHGEARA